MKHFSPSCALVALASAALMTACGQGLLSTDAAASTRAQELRVADATPAQVASMKDAVRPLVSHDPANVKVTQTKDRGVRRAFTAGFGTVMIAHKGADGKTTVSCVDNVDGVDQAMTAPAPKAVR